MHFHLLFVRLFSWLPSISLVLMSLVSFNSNATQTILVFGDSLSAAYGIDKNHGWVNLLQKELVEKHYDYQVINASISGETTAGGLSRIQQQLEQHQPNIVILALGANDGLRGLEIKQIKTNLEKIIKKGQNAKAKILLLGIKIPPNYGFTYTRQFEQIYFDLAKAYKLSFRPFFLEGISGEPTLNQEDGIHPNAQAQPLIVDNIWPALSTLLKP
ncbi:MAG: arylesterase [Methylophilus sp.]